jgi:hypothetical protein
MSFETSAFSAVPPIDLEKTSKEECMHRPWQNCDCAEKEAAAKSFVKVVDELNNLGAALKLIGQHLKHDSYCPINECGKCGCSSSKFVQNLDTIYNQMHERLRILHIYLTTNTPA